MRTPSNRRDSRQTAKASKSQKSHGTLAIVMIVILLGIITAGIYILDKEGKIDILLFNNPTEKILDESTPVPEYTSEEATASPESIATSTPAPTKKAYIPDIDELQTLPDPSTIRLTEDKLTVEVTAEISSVSWREYADASYYVLAVYNSKYDEVQKDILWTEITNWQVPNFTSGKVILYVYKDNGETGAQDDEIIDVYSYEVLPVDGEEIPFSPVKNKYYLLVDKSSFAFSVFTYDENGEYTILLHTFPCALGTSDRMTTVGVWEISSKGPWKDWGTGAYSPYYCRFTAGLYMHGSLYDGKNSGNMYTNSYEDIGTKATSGCIRTTVEAAEWVYYNCPAGTIIEIVEESDLVVYPGKPAIDPDYPRWDPTDPGKPGN
ncbi:MAG: L,D-transpeptidase [Eubacteriales bacterium]